MGKKEVLARDRQPFLVTDSILILRRTVDQRLTMWI